MELGPNLFCLICKSNFNPQSILSFLKVQLQPLDAIGAQRFYASCNSTLSKQLGPGHFLSSCNSTLDMQLGVISIYLPVASLPSTHNSGAGHFFPSCNSIPGMQLGHPPFSCPCCKPTIDTQLRSTQFYPSLLAPLYLYYLRFSIDRY